ncbi:MAG: nucleotidyltransferase family protein [Bacilli bacterium]
MNNTQIQLVKLLNKSLAKEKIDIDKNINLSELISEAKINKVEALIYSAISEESKNIIDTEILNDLKKTTFYSGVQQLNHIKEVSRILKRFQNEKIDVLVLKGLVIRDLYPNPTLRTMSDADIVVKETDLEKSKELMLDLGYEEHHSSPSHFVYVKPGCLPIELHWNLADEHFFKNISMFEDGRDIIYQYDINSKTLKMFFELPFGAEIEYYKSS